MTERMQAFALVGRVSEAATVQLASIPSPDQSVWHLGPVPLRAYALCILVGIFVAMWLSNRRWLARGGQYGFITDVAVVAVPMGVLGGRLYHVITTPQPYFGEGGSFWRIFKIWEGGLGIWGAIALGGVGAWIVCRRRGIALPEVADAIAPGLAFAQAIGRLGNWFNQELYGKPTSLPWGLQIDPAHRTPDVANEPTFHPTFLYESLWNVGVGFLVIWADRRWQLTRGRAFALYVAAYTLGRTWIEMLRIDSANQVAGMRLNVWVSLVIFVLAVLYLVVVTRIERGGSAGLLGSSFGGRWAGSSGSSGRGSGRRSQATIGRGAGPRSGRSRTNAGLRSGRDDRHERSWSPGAPAAHPAPPHQSPPPASGPREPGYDQQRWSDPGQ